jgi:hypothetical protein
LFKTIANTIEGWLKAASAGARDLGNKPSRSAFEERVHYLHQCPSRIIKEFSDGWYGKTLFQEGDIGPDKASQFAHVPFKKLRAELRKRRVANA